MKKSYKKISFLLVIILLVQLIPHKIVYASIPRYNQYSGYIEHETKTTKAQNTNVIRFYTLGWYPTIIVNGKRYGAIAKVPQVTTNETDSYIWTKFEIPLTPSINQSAEYDKTALSEVIKYGYFGKYGFDESVFLDIEDFFFKGTTPTSSNQIIMNAVQVVKYPNGDGTYTNSGSLSNNYISYTDPRTNDSVSVNAPTPTGTVYMTKDQIANATDKNGNKIGWSSSLFNDYYDQPVYIDPSSINRTYFIDYVCENKDGTFESITSTEKKSVDVENGVPTKLSGTKRTFDGYEFVRMGIIYNRKQVLSSDEYKTFDISNSNEIPAITSIKQWNISPHLVYVYKDNRKQPPKAQLSLKKDGKEVSEIYVGETLNITGSATDDDDEPNTLNYSWTGTSSEIKGLSTSYPNVGGQYKFDKAGTYNVKFTVKDKDNQSDTVEKSIEVIPNGEVILSLKADNEPKTHKIGDNPKVDVKLSLEGSVRGLAEAGKEVESLQLAVTLAPKDFTGTGFMDITNTQEYKLEQNLTNINHDFTFNVDTENKEYTQYFRAYFVVNYTDGNQDFKQEDLTTIISKGVVEPVEPPKPVNNPPKVQVSAKNDVIMGQEIRITGEISDEDEGDTFTYHWSNNSNMVGSLSSLDNTVWFNKSGGQTVSLTARDSQGASDTDKAYINVRPAIPNVKMNIIGKLKENRKITIDTSSSNGGAEHYPVIWNDTIYEIFSPDGLSLDNVKTLVPYTIENNKDGIQCMKIKGDYKNIDLLFKEEGNYNIKCTLKNTAGYTSFSNKTINIKPDLPPIADIAIPKKVLRNPNDLSKNGLAQLSINIKNTSYSPDGDKIGKIAYTVTFDSDNDKDINEEITYIYNLNFNGTNQMPMNNSDNLHWQPICKFEDFSDINLNTINTGALNEITFKSTHVGKYLIHIIVQEDFSDDTIPEFIIEDDIKKATTYEGR